MRSTTHARAGPLTVVARRRLLGLTGAPGSGKSTFAASYAAEHAGVVVGMDGFHLPQSELVRRGLRDRMGAPDTFDAEGYAALLGRIRAGGLDVRAPAFDRTVEEPVAEAILVPGDAGLVITEGNYLLLEEARWEACREHLDEVWHLHVDPALRRERLLARHVAFGKTLEQARAWIADVDEPNARLVESASVRADRIVELTDWQPSQG